MARNTIQTTVQLHPYHIAGIHAISERQAKQGKAGGKGLLSALVREGLELVFEKYDITQEEIANNLEVGDK